ncbi:MAG: hypothetical protein KA270_13255 [Saprospiraceae bacterium]|nr:hypothetical protein [Saprospiraceae bacterium]MBP6568132.1 hypothetical protein [Saprospiraceae bacterium]
MAEAKDNDHFDQDYDGINREYLMSKEENQVLLTLLHMDLEHICKKIEFNLGANKSSSL